MSNLHRQLTDANLHNAKGFSAGASGSYLIKNENNIQSFERIPTLPSALNFVDGNAVPPTTANGDIYVLINEGNGPVNVAWQQVPITSYNSWVRRSGGVYIPINPVEGQYCHNKADGKLYFFDGTDWVATGGGSGKLGIYDANGKPTFYSTLPAAIAAAVSGDTIHQFTNISVTATPVIPVGVNYNGNNYTITNSVADGTSALSVAVNYKGNISNVICRKENFNAAAFLVPSGGVSPVNILFSGVKAISTLGTGFQTNSTFTEGLFDGIYADGITGITCYGGTVKNFTAQGSTAHGFLGFDSARAINGLCKTTTGTACQSPVAHNITAISVSGIVYNATSGYNCYGFTASGTGAFSSYMYNSFIYSTSGLGGNAYFFHNSEIISINNHALSSFGEGFAENCIVQSIGNRTIVKTLDFKHTLINNVIKCNWNNVAGHAVDGGIDSVIHGNTISVVNTNANGINGGTAYMSNNTVIGTTVGITATQLIVNTSDSQGNITQ